MSETTWLDDWWLQSRVELTMKRLELEAQDPGVPAWYGTALGAPTPGPVTYVAAAMSKLPRVLNFDKLHRRVLELMGQKPL